MVDIDLLKKAKKSKKMTFEELSAKSDVPISTIYDIFRGVTTAPRIDTMERINKALDIDAPKSDWTAEERAAGVVDSVKVSVTAQEYNLLDMFREIGRTKGADKQQIIIELLEILLKF